MRKSVLYNLLKLLTLTLTATISIYAFQIKHREFSLSKEKELRLIIDVSFGSISIEKGDRNKVAVIDFNEGEDDKQKIYVSYDLSDETGTLRIKLKESTRFWVDKKDDKSDRRHIDIKLNPNIPISFDVEFGAGKGDIDLTELRVKEMRISTGASDVTIKCNSPNPILAEEVTIESGVSKFHAVNLGNLNFKKMRFSGGVGAYKLDFGGKYHQSSNVEVEVGLGAISIYIPKSVPTKLTYDDNWLSSFNVDDDFTKIRKGIYETEDFREAFKRLTIKISSGLGSVKVIRK